MTNTTTVALADRFAEILREWLTADEFAAMKTANETDPDYAGSSCASHDYCDANEAMNAAWKELMGRDVNADDAEQATLWNAAWDLARQRHLGHPATVPA